MKKGAFLTTWTAFLVMPLMASAQFRADGGEFGDLLQNILAFASNVLIPFIIGIGFLTFVWGMFQFFIAGGANEEAKEKGKSLMIWATVGFVLIITFMGIINLLTSSTGLDRETIQNLPTVELGN